MITYQDFVNSESKEDFIEETINDFKVSDLYEGAVKSREYYEGRTDILERLKWFYDAMGGKEEDKFKANNKISNEFLRKIVMQETSYLFSNGVTIEDNIKESLGRKFDNALIKAATIAQLDSVAWGYSYIDNMGQYKVDIWKGTEFIPLFDERTGDLMAGIRFYQIDTDKPIFVELYELDGKTEYTQTNDGFKLTTAKQSYRITKAKDILGEKVISANNWSRLPISPLYYNSMHSNVLSLALKHKLDLYDIILSDFGNNLEDSQDVYWVIRNYAGQGMEQFLQDYKHYKIISTDNEGGAEAQTIEVPYQAREIALNILKKDIYDSSMSLDTSVLSGGALTNVAIKANMADLDLKTDEFEWCAIDFIENIVNLLMEYKAGLPQDYEVKFIRRSLINDTELVQNLMMIRTDISDETFYELLPYVDNPAKELERLAAQQPKIILEEPTI